MFCGFQCMGLTCLLSDVSLNILYFYAIVNGIFFNFNIWLLLAYRYTVDFCILILYPLYPATLLNLLIGSSRIFFFFCRLHWVFYVDDYQVCLISSILIWMNFSFIFFFLHLIALFRTSIQCWTEVRRVNITVLFLILEGTHSIFQH